MQYDVIKEQHDLIRVAKYVNACVLKQTLRVKHRISLVWQEEV